MLGWVLRFALFFLLLCVVIRTAWRFLEGVVEGSSPAPGGRVPQVNGKMVKDPVCGTYVVQTRALTASRGDETAWFCSDACRAQWQRRA